MNINVAIPMVFVVAIGLWVALWRDVSAANVIAGAGLAALLLFLGRRDARKYDVRLGAFIKLIFLIAVDLVRSTIGLAAEVITPTDNTNELIFSVELPEEAMRYPTTFATAITLTPGTAVIEADVENNSLLLHLLHAKNRESVEAHVQQLADLTVAAFPVLSVGEVE